MKLEELNISKQCLKEWRDSGFNEVDEIVNFIDGVLGNGGLVLSMSTKCFEEMGEKFVILGLLSDAKWRNGYEDEN
jgi:hypothetical protein